MGRGHSALTSCARCGSVPPLSGAEVYLELIALALAVLPLGAIGMRLAERAIGRTLSLTIPERLILCFYAAGAAFFVLASLPLAIYGVVLVAVVLVGGVVGYGVLAVSERGLGLRAVLSFARSFPALVVGGLTLALLGVEVAGAAPLLVGNVFDGSVHSLFITLLLRNHTLPWTLSPYASVGVTYPQGAPVWMSLPVLLFDWPVVSAPVDLPPLFLALSAPAAYCLGFRLAQGTSPTSAAEIGMVFSAFFALVAAFPRLWIGGSFDVAFGFGLFLATVGWIVAAAREPNLPWRAVAILGVLVGIQFSLSLMLGIAELLLLAGYAIVYQRASIAGLARWAVRWLAVVAISAGFLVRSLLGVAVWFRDPGHVLTPVGQRPLAPSMLAPLLTSRNLDGELNPFVLFKPKLSPFPWMSLEIMVLVGAGLVLAGALVALPPVRRAIPVPSELATSVLIGTLIAFVSAGGLILAESVTGPAGVISVTNSDEASAVLFTFYEMLAVLPLIAVVGWWRDLRLHNPAKLTETGRLPPPRVRTPATRRAWVRAVAVAFVLVLPLGSGLGVTALVVPGYITGHIDQFANVTPEDLAALEWAGGHLPTCSRVLVAPGSVGQYLPEYALVTLVFPMFPTPTNLSYHLLVEELTSGNYSGVARGQLLGLGISEVLVTGMNSVGYPPFLLAPLIASPDFRTLDQSGTVAVLEFIPGATAIGCSP